MVNMLSCYTSMLHKVVNFTGMHPVKVEIEQGTVINFWVPSKPENAKPKPALVLIHGFAGDGILNWQFQMLSSSLRKKYSIYVPDLLFFGRSHTSRVDRSTRFQGDCIAAGLRKLGVVEKCAVVGLSYGGFVGFQMAQHHPDLVQSMVIIGSTVALTQSLSDKVLERLGFESWSDLLLPTTPQGVKVLFQVGSYKLHKLLLNFLRKQYLEVMFSNRKERKELLEALVIRDEDATDHQFQQRIHLIWGYEDKVFDMEDANNLKEKLGGETKMIKVEKAGHLVLERPFVLNKCLKQLLHSYICNIYCVHQEHVLQIFISEQSL